MKRQITKGSTSVILDIFIQDSSSSVGAGLAGLAFGTSGLTCYYHRNSAAAPVAVSLITMTVGTFTSSGFKEIDSTNMPGWYQLCLPDAAFASGAESVGAHLKGAANMVPLPLEIELLAVNLQDAVRAGLAALPNAAAEASGGIATLSAAQASNGTINANVHRWLAGTPNALQSGRVDSYIGAVASGVIAAASFAANALDAVWSTATRLLTAGTNIVLTKGTGVTGFNDLDAAGVRSAVGLASANLDTQLTTIDDFLDTEVAAIKAKTDNLPAAPAAVGDIPTVGAIADQVWDELLSGHAVSGSTGAALTAAESGGAPTANQNADALLDRADAIENGLTPRQALRLTTAALAGEVSGASTTLITIRNAVADSKARITASVDENGNRTAVNTDVTLSAYFAQRYFAPRYFPHYGAAATVPGAPAFDAMASAFDAALSGPMRAVVTALLTGRGDVWRNPSVTGGKRSAPTLHAASVPLRLATADASALQLLADLGAEKANRIIRMRYDADILEGDELHIGAVVYQVERVAVARDKTLLAVWEVRT